MKIRSPQYLWKLCLAAACVGFLSGCSALKPVEDRTAYYRLSAMHLEQSGVGDLVKMPLESVVDVSFPNDVHSSKLMVLDGANAVILFDQARWMEPFESAFERTLDLNVRALIREPSEDLSLEIDVLSFVATPDSVKCQFSYRWSQDPATVGVLEVSEAWQMGETMESLVEAIDRVTAQMATRVVAEM